MYLIAINSYLKYYVFFQKKNFFYRINEICNINWLFWKEKTKTKKN